MITIEEPIGRALQDFCHVEWYEVEELAMLARSGEAKFDVAALRQQFELLLSRPAGIYMPLNKLTANEFESDEEARAWLESIYRIIFF